MNRATLVGENSHGHSSIERGILTNFDGHDNAEAIACLVRKEGWSYD